MLEVLQRELSVPALGARPLSGLNESGDTAMIAHSQRENNRANLAITVDPF